MQLEKKCQYFKQRLIEQLGHDILLLEKINHHWSKTTYLFQNKVITRLITREDRVIYEHVNKHSKKVMLQTEDQVGHQK
jgi:hypothetical protein